MVSASRRQHICARSCKSRLNTQEHLPSGDRGLSTASWGATHPGELPPSGKKLVQAELVPNHFSSFSLLEEMQKHWKRE